VLRGSEKSLLLTQKKSDHFPMKSQSVMLFSLFILLLPATLLAQKKEERPKVGVVLSGGGAKGFAHIGALKVLMEAGVPIDYIGGTSMGGIVGGLFALGYTPEALEQLVLRQDWQKVLSDEISRRNLSMKEKEVHEKYFFSLPIIDSKIRLPLGLVSGQSVFNILSNYGSPGYKYADFNDFPIPFLCIAADIETGESVILNDGHLPLALRATMAIPTVFSPIEIDGRLLVDGGLVNNFPVKEVKDMGADIIIGVDVQSKLHTKEELNSFVRILDQSSAFLRRPLYDKAKEMTDYYIKPDLAGFGVSSFTSADTIIKCGETAAQKILPEILQLVERLKTYDDYDPVAIEPAEPIDLIYLQEIVIEGIDVVSPNFVNNHLQLTVPVYIYFQDIIRRVEKLYATRNFNHIHYHLTLLDRGGYRLTLFLEEKVGAELSVGINYNSDLKASFLVNTTFRNLIAPNDRLSLSLDLGDNSGFDADYLIDRGWKPGLGANINGYTFDVNIFDEKIKVASFAYSSVTASIFTQSNLRNFSVIGGGVELEYSSLRSNVFVFDIENTSEFNTNYFGFLRFDDLDRKVYPRRGRKFDGEIKLITNLKDSIVPSADPVLFATARFFQAVPVNERLVILPQFTGGSLLSFGEVIPPQYQMYLGGMTDKYGNGLFPFVGLEFMQIAGNHAFAGRLDLQYEVFSNIYATARWNIGFRSEALRYLFFEHKPVNGYGASLGVRTPIGPIEVSLMNSDFNNSWIGYFNLGYMF
jgi:NTE family protein